MFAEPGSRRGFVLLLLAGLLSIGLIGTWQYVGWVLQADGDHARALAGNGGRLARPLVVALLGYAALFGLGGFCFYPAWVGRRRRLPLAVGLWLLQLPASRPGLLDLAARHLPRLTSLDGYQLYPAWFGLGAQLLWWAWLLVVLRFWCSRVVAPHARRMTATLLGLGVVGWVAWPWLAAPGLDRALVRPEQPNILILAVDSLRADHLGCYGYARNVSPNLDRLSTTGVRFEAAFTDSGGTLPSWATMLSGKSAPRHGLRFHFPTSAALERFEADPDRLPVRLAAAGYHTAVSSGWAGDAFRQVDFGFETVATFAPRGLEVYLHDGLYICHPLLALVFCRSPLERLFPQLSRSRALLYPEALTDQTVGMIERLGGGARPFFLVHFGSAPHYPYFSSRDQAGRFNHADYRGASRYRLNWSIDRQLFSGKSPALEEQRQAIALYDAAIATFDRRAARILRVLRATSRRPTLVIVTSDHGEGFFERRGLTGHGTDFARGDPVYRVPLLIQGLGLEAGQIRGVVRTVDLAPTIAELAKVSPGPSWQGKSLVGAMRRGRLAQPRTAYAETTYLFAPGRYPWALVPHSAGRPALRPSARPAPYFELRPDLVESVVAAKLRMLRTDRYKLLRIPSQMGPIELLFDLQRDPACRQDLSRRLPRRRAALSRLLDKWCRAR